MTRRILYPFIALVLSAGPGCGGSFMHALTGDDPEECAKTVDQLTAMDGSEPPGFNLVGRWTCHYDTPAGESASEYFHVSQESDKVIMEGRNNFGSNLVVEGHLSGDRYVARYGKYGGLSTKVRGGGRMLDGETVYYAENNGSLPSACHKTRYTCSRVE